MIARKTGIPAPTRPNATLPNAIQVEVLSGLHSGAKLTLSGQSCTIGAALDCDIVLREEVIAERHLQLRFYGRELAVNATGGDVDVENRARIKQGFGARVPLPATLIFGDTRLSVSRPHTGLGNVLPFRQALFVIAAMIALSGGFYGASSLLNTPAEAAVDHGETAATTAHKAPEALPPTPDRMLEARLAARGLDSLTITRRPKEFRVSGELSPEQMTAWQEIQRWFDGEFGLSYVLVSEVTQTEPVIAPKISFQAVWFGENPYVVDADGSRRYPGAALRNGWMLRAIEPGRVILSRNGADFVLTL